MSVVASCISVPLIATKIFAPSLVFRSSEIKHRLFHQTPTRYRKMVSKLDSTQRLSLLGPILNNGWTMDTSGRDAIKKKFVFGDFNEAFGFMTRVAIKGKL